MKAIKYTPKEIDVEIANISLLTVKEAKALPENIRRYVAGWWLQSPGYISFLASGVYNFGDVNINAYSVDDDDVCVRPAITISNARLKIGDIITIQNKKYVAIASNRVLYDDKVVYHRFDASTNDYDNSEIKKIVDEWLEGGK
ncbi:MAG: hypothetical protein J6S67_07440 [Methanobrevibacter sp.]|nr:hypothetical protein [Methanobrevibacter sp.]